MTETTKKRTPIERARRIFTDWHVDEVTDRREARKYADRLLNRLDEAGLTITEKPHA